MQPGMQAYRVVSPLATHYRPGTCEEADCSQQAHGWQTRLDLKTELGVRQATYIRSQSGRTFVEQLDPASCTVLFIFAPDQPCFSSVNDNGRPRQGHYIPLERPELYLVDSAGGRRIHSGGDAWVDDLCTNQSIIADLQNKVKE